MKSQKKSTLEKYYISEAFDKDRNVSFNFKKANQKISGNFAEFTDAVEKYIQVSELTQNDTRVWFHRDGAYRGSVGIEKARLIIEKVKEKQVKNQDVITYIEQENLVDKPAPKAVDLDEKASEVSFYVENVEGKKASEVKAEDIKAESEYPVVVEKIVANEESLDIYYHIKNKNKKSATTVSTLTGFLAEEKTEVCECETVACHNTTDAIQYTGRRRNKGFWVLVSALIVLILINIILIALRVSQVI
ncbi:hypothetical protein AB5V95_00450 [Metamycoplasma spumans]|uniref:hypothetical protein n=1 Tax=Metamycoplasma spumans TaxID=92406 RepID=UPI0034DD5BCB